MCLSLLMCQMLCWAMGGHWPINRPNVCPCKVYNWRANFFFSHHQEIHAKLRTSLPGKEKACHLLQVQHKYIALMQMILVGIGSWFLPTIKTLHLWLSPSSQKESPLPWNMLAFGTGRSYWFLQAKKDLLHFCKSIFKKINASSSRNWFPFHYVAKQTSWVYLGLQDSAWNIKMILIS